MRNKWTDRGGGGVIQERTDEEEGKIQTITQYLRRKELDWYWEWS
jgi:hypothetical protein